MQQQPKLNLIYVASTGRSGSTLLDMLLGSHSQIATAGEIQIWPHEILQGGVVPCGCGKPIPECSFWTELYPRVAPLAQPEPQVHFFRERHNAGKTLRWQHLLEFSRGEAPEKTAEKIKIYRRNNYQLFKEFIDLMQEKTGIRPQWIVDASKDPYRLLWLLKSNLFNIRVLRIIKEPRAFMYSMIKSVLNKEEPIQHQVLNLTAKKSFSWVLHNYLISQIARSHLTSLDYLLVQYEKIASQPKQSMEEIYKFIGCEVEDYAIANLRESNMHTIAGNSMRYEKRGIVLDEA